MKRFPGPAPASIVLVVLLAAGCRHVGEMETPGPATVDASLVGTEFVAQTSSGERRGMDFVGAELVGLTEAGTEAPLRIESIERSERPGFEDVLRYVVTIDAGSVRSYLCGVDGSVQPIRAIPLQGRWDHSAGRSTSGSWIPDPSAFTFACEGAALAKCVYLGFKPWAGKVTHCSTPARCRTAELGRLHQACVRMFRADYCGDGVPHTVDGVLISFHDGFGLLQAKEDWPHEAEWAAEGARCITRIRVPELGPPHCLERLRIPDCGDEEHFGQGTLLMSGVGPRSERESRP